MGSSVLNHQIQHNSGQEPAASDNVSPNGSLAIRSGSSMISKDVALPRVVLCLAHNASDGLSCCLAGEWISGSEGIDTRYVKLEPLFRCSILKCGGIQSIPLTVEWSASPPHDYLLAGCHDGTIALWKFSASCSSEDTRPLLCFSADTVPITALSWAPLESVPEIANVI
ncbi:hypothetical protein CMV_002774 [Castanea mollissima]|uniref:Uncharacterized protein n=1 Tax=Castanea mollissima TaxID=60419 RepID=A0A8J4VX91_9ROSI|nr:hypothetical protein CMV_002774 [Castanea mollissima]